MPHTHTHISREKKATKRVLIDRGGRARGEKVLDGVVVLIYLLELEQSKSCREVFFFLILHFLEKGSDIYYYHHCFGVQARG